MGDILVWVVYLIQFYLYGQISLRVVRTVGVSRVGSLWAVQAFTLMFVAEVAITLLLLGRTWNPALLAFVLVAYEIPLLVAPFLRPLVTLDYSADLLAFQLRQGARGRSTNTILSPSGLLAGLGASALIVLVSTVAYVQNPRPSTELTAWLLAAQAIGYAVLTLNNSRVTMALLSSAALSDRTRLIQLVLGLTAVAPMTLWLAFLASALAWSSPAAVSIGSFAFGFSPFVALAVVTFIGVTALIPYAIGIRQRGRERTELLKSERDWLGRLIDILAVPDRAGFAGELESFKDDAVESFETLGEQHPELAIQPDAELDPDVLVQAASANLVIPVRHEEGELAAAQFHELFPRMARRDPVFRLRDRLTEVIDAATEIADRLTGAKTPTAGRNLARSWSDVLRRHEESLKEELGSLATGSRTSAAVGFAVTAVAGVFLNQVGKWAWDTLVGGT